MSLTSAIDPPHQGLGQEQPLERKCRSQQCWWRWQEQGREGGQHAESRAEAGEVPLTQRCGCPSPGRTGQPPAPCSAPPPGISAFAVVHSSWFLVPFSATHAVPSLMQCIPARRPTASCRKAVDIHVQCLSISSAGERAAGASTALPRVLPLYLCLPCFE